MVLKSFKFILERSGTTVYGLIKELVLKSHLTV
jgi:hypothetical protein